MPKVFDLNVDVPTELPKVLRDAAQRFREDESELQASWGEPNAGRVWGAYATILERAAKSAERACKKHFR